MAALLCAAGAGARAEPPGGVEGMLSIRLDGGIAYGRPGRRSAEESDRRAFQVDVTCLDGRWSAVAWGFDERLAGLEHRGEMVRTSLAGNRLRLVVRIEIAPYPRYDRMRGTLIGCTVGGRAEYTIDLARSGGIWRGRYTGELKAQRPEWLTGASAGDGGPHGENDPLARAVWLHTGKLAGQAVGAVEPSMLDRRFRLAGHKPPAPGEHPRLLFRKGDLPALRRRMHTPHGRKVLDALAKCLDREKLGFRFLGPSARTYMEGNWSAGHALMYVLTGRREHVRRARRLMVRALHAPVGMHGNYGFAHRILCTAITYDLLYDQLDEEIRREMLVFLERNARRTMTFTAGRNPLNLGRMLRFGTDNAEQDLFPCPMPGSPGSPYVAGFRAAAGVAAMAILGDPVDLPPPPPPGEAPRIEPADNYQPPVGVPVLPFTDDVMPRTWLINGPFLKSNGDDPLAPIGGVARARPMPGTVVGSAGVKLDFRRFYANAHPAAGRGGSPTYALWPRNNGAALGYSPKYGGYKPAAKVLAKAGSDQTAPRTYTLYTVLSNDEPRIVQGRPNWGSHGAGASMYVNGRRLLDGQLARLKRGLYPVMVEISPLGGYAASAPRLAEYVPTDRAQDLAAHRRALAAYKAAGSQMPGTRRHLRAAARSLRRYMAGTIDPNGWGAEALETLLPFLHAYRNVEGVDLAAGTGLKQLLRPIVRRAGRPLPRDALTVSQAFGLLPAAHQPVAKWYLDAHGIPVDLPNHAILPLATHRPALRARPPGEVFALSGDYRRSGLYSFTSDWSDPNGFQVMVYRGSGSPAAHYRGGHFSIRGLGRVWASLGGSYGRAGCNTVRLDTLFRAGGARPIHARYRPDGSGVVSLRIDRFHRGFSYPRRGRERIVVDSKSAAKVSILRSIAVDYSAASGSPALIALADRIVGAGRREKIWRMHPGGGLGPVRFDRAGGTFTVAGRDAGGPNLRGWFLCPPRDRLRFGPNGRLDKVRADVCHVSVDRRETVPHPDTDPLERLTKTLRQLADPKKRQQYSHDDPALDSLEHQVLEQIRARANEPGNGRRGPTFFLVVMTIQKGPPPKLTATGTGEQAVVTVGRQTIRFDGRKLVLGTW